MEFVNKFELFFKHVLNVLALLRMNFEYSEDVLFVIALPI